MKDKRYCVIHQAENLTRVYGQGDTAIIALDHVNLSIAACADRIVHLKDGAVIEETCNSH